MTDPIILLFTGLLGACVGSLLNVVIWRLPRMIAGQEGPDFNLWLPRSHCPQCRHALAWYDNIPLFGWLMLRGRCRYCAKLIPWRYPLIELASMLLCLLSAVLLPPDKTLLATWLLGWLLMALVLIDIEHQLLPDLLTLPLLWLGLLLHAVDWLPQAALQQSVIGAASGYLALWLLAHGYRLLRGREALGMGDAKLLAALGAWLGWQSLPLLLLMASAGSLLCLLLIRPIARRALNDPFPFGPGLAGAGLLLYLAENYS